LHQMLFIQQKLQQCHDPTFDLAQLSSEAIFKIVDMALPQGAVSRLRLRAY